MAQQLYQLSDVQEAFAARVQAKVQDRREQTQDKAGDVPLIGWLLRPLAGWAFDSREHSNTRLGERGEEAVLHSLLRWQASEAWRTQARGSCQAMRVRPTREAPRVSGREKCLKVAGSWVASRL